MKQKILNFIARFHFVLIIEVKSAPAPEPTVLELTGVEIPETGTRERIKYFTAVRNDAIENLDAARADYKEAKAANALAAKAAS